MSRKNYKIIKLLDEFSAASFEMISNIETTTMHKKGTIKNIYIKYAHYTGLDKKVLLFFLVSFFLSVYKINEKIPEPNSVNRE